MQSVTRKSRGGHIVLGAVMAAALVAFAVTPVLRADDTPPRPPAQKPAAGTRPSAQSGTTDQADALYNEGLTLARSGDFAKARDLFERAHRVKKDDPEILNMLAFTQRKTGQLDQAFENYGRALRIKPRFPQAREYLGEAHLQAALRELETLKGYGPEGAEDARQLVEAIRQAAASATAGEPEPAKGAAPKGNW